MINRLVHYDGRRPQAHVENLVANVQTGDVGIGTSTPSSKLHIQDSASLTTLQVRSSATAADGVGGKIIFGQSNDGIAQIEGKYNGGTGPSNKDLLFYSAGNLGTPKMVLDGNGHLGVGNTNPSSLLHIEGASAKQIIQATSGNPEIEFNDGGTDEFSIYYDTGNKSLNFVEGGIGAHLAIKDGGNVGIGTTTPIAKLHVEGNIYVTSNVTFTDPLAIQRPTGNVLVHTATGEVITSNAMNFDQGNVNATNVTVTTLGFDGGGGSGPVSSLTLQDVTEQGASTDRTVTFSNATTAFTTTANVVIGSTCTINDSGTAVTISRGSSGVTVSGNANELFIEDDVNCGLTIACPENRVGSIHFSNPGAPLAGRIRYNHSSNSMIFDTNNENGGWLFLDKYGQLGINQDPPEHALHVGNDALVANTSTNFVGIGTASPTVPLSVYHPTNNSVLLLQSGDPNVNIVFADDTTTNRPYLQCTGNDLIMGHVSGGNRVVLTDTSNLSVDSSTFFVDGVNDKVGIGSTTPASPLTVEYSGAGTSTIRVDSDENAILATRYRNGIGADNGCEVIIQTSNTNSGVGDVGQLKTGDAVGDIQWKGGSDSSTYQPMGRIKVVAKTNVTSSDAASEMRFYTTSSGSGNVTQRMAIDENGRVGIGVVDPNLLFPLQVTTNTGTPPQALQLNTTDWTTSVGSSFQFGFGAATGDTYSEIRALRGGYNVWSNLVMQLNGGNVGIGIDTPARTLHVSSGSGQGIAAFQNDVCGLVVQANGGGANQIEIVGYRQTPNGYSNVLIRADSSDSTGIYLKQGSTPYVGIGTNNPEYQLHVVRKAGTSGTMLVDGDSSVSGNPKIIFRDTNTSKVGILGFNDTVNTFSLNSTIDITPVGTGGNGIKSIQVQSKEFQYTGGTGTGYSIFRVTKGSITGGSSYSNLSGHIKVIGFIRYSPTYYIVSYVYSADIDLIQSGSGNITLYTRNANLNRIASNAAGVDVTAVTITALSPSQTTTDIEVSLTIVGTASAGPFDASSYLRSEVSGLCSAQDTNQLYTFTPL